jgi:hypothetical protein
MKKFTKSTAYPVAIFALLVGLVVLFLASFQVRVWVEPGNSKTVSVPKAQTTGSPLLEKADELSAILPSPSPTSSPQPQPSNKEARQGAFRAGNPTEHPVRIALLARGSESDYSEPAHWDFAPGEGSLQGLILSLPQEDLQLKPGDVLVAFAQDGSRRYWGPFVVGETPEPVWEQQTGQWRLILQQ